MDIEGEEDGEVVYFEVVEYVCMVVLMIYIEFGLDCDNLILFGVIIY